MANKFFTPKFSFLDQNPYQGNSVQGYQADLQSSINQMRDFANEYANQGNKYSEQMIGYMDQYEKLMQELLSQKNKLTGNIFTDFVNQYKEGRGSDFGKSMFSAGQSTGNWIGQQASNAGNFISKLFPKKIADSQWISDYANSSSPDPAWDRGF